MAHIRPIHRRTFALLLLAAAMSPPAPAAAHHLVESEPVFCDARFPCSERLKSRINFWVQVFSRWGTDESVFHDSRFPERVYAVVKSDGTCARRTRHAQLNGEYKRIKKTLGSLARNAAIGGSVLNAEEHHILKLFPQPNPAKLRAAAGRIRCQQGNRDRFRAALQRYGAYHDMVRNILRDADLSPDIQYLPFVESAYNPRAMSRAGAAGLWQIMPRTGQRFGLQLSGAIDERLDPEAATRAAVRYLQKSEQVLSEAASAFGAPSAGELNPFIITSYNYGVTGVRRSILQFGPDFDTVLEEYESPRFKIAVKNFYASFLAARHVARAAERYFRGVEWDEPFDYHTHVLKHPTSIARINKIFKVPQNQLRKWNSALTRYVWHGWRFIPAGYHLRLPPKAGGWKKEIRRLAQLQPEREDVAGLRYRVKRGDTACAIARAFNVNCQRLLAVNDLNRRGLILVGQTLTIPGRKTVTNANPIRYRIKRGDSVCGIARVFNIKCSRLLAANQLDKRGLIFAGQTLLIPGRKSSTKKAVPKATVAVAKTVAKKAEPSTEATVTTVKTATEKTTPPKSALPSSLKPLPQKRPRRPAEMPLTPQLLVEKTPPPEVPTVPTSEPAALAGESVTADEEEFLSVLDQPLDFAVYEEPGEGGEFFIFVLPEETLGHFSDWLKLGYTKRMREFNNMGKNRQVRIGQRIRLPIVDRTEVAIFERRRQDYHGLLVEEFKENYRVEMLEKYSIARGDSLWTIAGKKEIPIWLLLRFNPSLDRKPLRSAQVLDVPVLAERG